MRLKIKEKDVDNIYETSLKEKIKYTMNRFFWKNPRTFSLMHTVSLIFAKINNSFLFDDFYMVFCQIFLFAFSTCLQSKVGDIPFLCFWTFVITIWTIIYFLKKKVNLSLNKFDQYFKKLAKSMFETNEKKYVFLAKYIAESEADKLCRPFDFENLCPDDCEKCEGCKTVTYKKLASLNHELDSNENLSKKDVKRIKKYINDLKKWKKKNGV